VANVRGQNEHRARTNRIGAVLGQELAGAGDDVLRFLGLICVPAEMPAGSISKTTVDDWSAPNPP